MGIKKVFIQVGKVSLYLLGFLLLLLIGGIFFVNTNQGKRVIRDKAQSYLQSKLKTKLNIGSLDYQFPNWVEIDHVYLEDQLQDTLLSGKVMIDLDMLQLIHGSIYIRKVELGNVFVNISRPKTDSLFNYQFLIDAFSSKRSHDTTALKITLKELLLHDIRLKFMDGLGGEDVKATIGSLTTSFKTFQPDRLQFDILQMKGDGIELSAIKTRDEGRGTKDEDTHPPTGATKNNLKLLVSRLDLTNLHASYQNKTNGMNSVNQVHHLAFSGLDVNMDKEAVGAGLFLLDSSSLKFVASNERISGSATPSPSPLQKTGWKLHIDSFINNNNHIRFDDPTVAVLKAGLDASHLDIQNMKVIAGKTAYAAGGFSTTIHQLSFKDKSGFMVDTTHAIVQYDPKGLSVREIYIKTPLSLIQSSIDLQYNDTKQLMSTPSQTRVNLQFVHSEIAMNELYTLSDKFKKYMPPHAYKGDMVRLNTAVTGTLKDLYIPFLQLTGFSGTVVNAKAILHNATDPKRFGYDLVVYNSAFPRSDLLRFIPPMPDSVSHKIPDLLNLSGKLKGDMNHVEMDLIAGGSDGGVTVKGQLSALRSQRSAIRYDLGFTLNEFRLGHLLDRDTLIGNVSLSGTANGNGIDYKTMNAFISASVQKAGFKQYDYHDISLHATFNGGNIVSEGVVRDTNVSMHYSAVANVSGSYPSDVEARITVDTLQLLGLHLYKEVFNASSKLYLKAASLDPKSLNLYALVDSSKIRVKNKFSALDSLQMTASVSTGEHILSLRSP